MEKDILYLWINLIQGVGDVRINKLIKELGGIEKVYEASKEEIMKIEGFGKVVAGRIASCKDLNKARKIKNYCVENGIKILCREDRDYFKEFLKYEDAPSMLYTCGKIKKIKNTIGVVGSRNADLYGKNIALEIGDNASENDVTIISGMSEGIEAYVQSGIIRKDGYSICVLGTGIDGCYPAINKRLKTALKEKCLIISPFKIGSKPIRENFFKRNKLIAMLSNKVVVIQANKNSASLITAKYAIKEGKEVYAVPGNIDNELNEGSNILLRNGAKVYTAISNIIRRKNKKNIEENKGEEKRIIRVIKEKPKSIDELELILKLEKEVLVDKLFNLELAGAIVQQNGQYF
ncbi:MAG: DNA-processing protein DprA [Clostridium sp.]